MINWKVRIKNKLFWVAIIPASLLAIKSIAAVFGMEIDVAEISDRLVDAVEAIFIVLGILGIVVDPTTKGLHDSERALDYNEPN